MSNKERPRWRVNELSFIGHTMAQAGAEVFYTPTEDAAGKTNGVGANLSPLNDAAQAIVDAQAKEHPDKSNLASRKAKAEAEAAAQAAEDDKAAADGLVKGKRGDTRSKGTDGGEKPARGKKDTAGTTDPDEAGDIA